MKKRSVRDRKYFAPQDEGEFHPCDAPGCKERGEFRAPKDKNLKDYYWFCLKHVQEYNSRWNYYDGAEPEEQEAKSSRRFRGFSSKIRYSFGFNFEEEFAAGKYNFSHFDYADALYTRQEREYLKIMELSVQDELNGDILKKQYKKLVKLYHPDLHHNDPEKEEKFKLLNNAYNYLLGRFNPVKKA